jgi:hypothetical protein
MKLDPHGLVSTTSLIRKALTAMNGNVNEAVEYLSRTLSHDYPNAKAAARVIALRAKGASHVAIEKSGFITAAA